MFRLEAGGKGGRRRRKEHPRLVASFNVSVSGDEWLSVDMTQAVKDWVTQPQGDADVLVHCPGERQVAIFYCLIGDLAEDLVTYMTNHLVNFTFHLLQLVAPRHLRSTPPSSGRLRRRGRGHPHERRRQRLLRSHARRPHVAAGGPARQALQGGRSIQADFSYIFV